MKKISDQKISQDLEDLESIENTDSSKVLRYPRKRGARQVRLDEVETDLE